MKPTITYLLLISLASSSNAKSIFSSGRSSMSSSNFTVKSSPSITKSAPTITVRPVPNYNYAAKGVIVPSTVKPFVNAKPLGANLVKVQPITPRTIVVIKSRPKIIYIAPSLPVYIKRPRINQTGQHYPNYTPNSITFQNQVQTLPLTYEQQEDQKDREFKREMIIFLTVTIISIFIVVGVVKYFVP